MAVSLTRNIKSFLISDFDAKEAPDNGAHTSEGARNSGFSDALVRGVTSFAWCYNQIIQAYGESNFLKNGFIDIKFIRPIYPNRDIQIIFNQNESNPNEFNLNYYDITDKNNKINKNDTKTNDTNNATTHNTQNSGNLCVIGNGSVDYSNETVLEYIATHVFKANIFDSSKIDDNKYDKSVNSKIIGTEFVSQNEHLLFDNYLKRRDCYVSYKENKEFIENVGKDGRDGGGSDSTLHYSVDRLHPSYLMKFMMDILYGMFTFGGNGSGSDSDGSNNRSWFHTRSQILFINNSEDKDGLDAMKVNQVFKSYGKLYRNGINEKSGNRWAEVHGLICNEKNQSIAFVKQWIVYELGNKHNKYKQRKNGNGKQTKSKL